MILIPYVMLNERPWLFTSHNALSMLNKWKGRRRAAFWRQQGFPNCALARAAWCRQRGKLLLEQWKREELKRSPFALLDEVPSYEELAARFKVSYRRRSSSRPVKPRSK